MVTIHAEIIVLLRYKFLVSIQRIQLFTYMVFDVTDPAVDFVEVLRNIPVYDGLQILNFIRLNFKSFIIFQQINH